MKKFTLLISALLLFAMAVAGCGSKQETPKTFDDVVTTSEAKQLILNFATALEKYDTKSLLAALDKSLFTLKFENKDITKSYKELEAEFANMKYENGQPQWRIDHGYSLTLEFNDIYFNNTSSYVFVSNVIEITDGSTTKKEGFAITFDLVKKNGQCLVSEIRIKNADNTNGFGFN